MINVEVAYALPQRQQIIALKVEPDCTVYEAAERSGIIGQFPEIDLANAKMGIFGKVVANPRAATLADGDRIEIYRPLIADPKVVRKQRAERVRTEKANSKR